MFTSIYSIVAATVVLYMLAWFIVSVYAEDNSVVDIAWGLGFIVIAAVTMYTTTITLTGSIVFAMILVWGLRLSLHIAHRAHLRKSEDFRYASWRKAWGKYVYIRSFLQIYVLQGVLMYIIALPVVFAISNGVNVVSWYHVLGIVLWCIGYLFESIADSQLRHFKECNTEKHAILQSGLWRYSRHPNYFGEILQWWGVGTIAFMAPGGLIAIVSPVLITYLLLFVSGVPMLEKKYENNAAFQVYKARTNAVFPWFSKK